MKRKFFITTVIIIICAISVFLAACGALSDYNSTQSPDLIKTDEQNYSNSRASYINMQQNDLFNFADLIFEGTFKRSENYTYVYYEDNNEYEEYYTFYYFVVNNIYYGDETLLNKEIKLGQRNTRYSDDLEEIILKEDTNYIILSEQHTDFELEKLFGTPLYAISLYQYVFEISDSNIYISYELFGLNILESKVKSEVADFMDYWLKKQNDEIPKTDEIFTYSNIEIVKSILEITEISVDTNTGIKNRLSIRQSIFNDFIIEAINYYKNK